MVENGRLQALPSEKGEGNSSPTQASEGPRSSSNIIKSIEKWQNRPAVVRNGEKLVEIGLQELEKLKNALRGEAKGSQEEGIKELLTITKEIRNKLPTTNTQKTWSQVAMAGVTQAIPRVNTNAATTNQSADNRKRRELIVTVRDKAQQEAIARRAPEATLEVLRSTEPRHATDKIVTARRLPSGDLQLITADETSRKELETTHEWLRTIAESAEVKKARYTVWVHGVRVKGVPTSNQKQAIETIRKANEKLHPGLQITRVGWRKKDLERPYSSLILDTTDHIMANDIIQKGLVHEGEIKTCVRFIRAARITQCVRCNRYGHVATHCKYPQCCGICAEDHPSTHCKKDQDGARGKQKCPLCKERHTAWSRVCKIRQQQTNRAQLALLTTPTLYEDLRANTSNNELRPIFQLESQNSEGSTTAARRGRPSLLTKAGQAENQARIFVENRKRARPDSNPETMAVNLSSQIPPSLTFQSLSQIPSPQEQDTNTDTTTQPTSTIYEDAQQPPSQSSQSNEK
jgi:hypothetical protein